MKYMYLGFIVGEVYDIAHDVHKYVCSSKNERTLIHRAKGISRERSNCTIVVYRVPLGKFNRDHVDISDFSYMCYV